MVLSCAMGLGPPLFFSLYHTDTPMGIPRVRQAVWRLAHPRPSGGGARVVATAQGPASDQPGATPRERAISFSAHVRRGAGFGLGGMMTRREARHESQLH